MASGQPDDDEVNSAASDSASASTPGTAQPADDAENIRASTQEADSDDLSDDAPDAMVRAVQEALKAGNSGSPIFVIGKWSSQHNSDYTVGDAITQNISAARDASVRIEGETASETTGAATAEEIRKFSGDVVQWWEQETPSAEDLCRLIAIAVLEGASYLSILSYSQQLLPHFGPALDADKNEPKGRPQTVGRVLARLGAYRARQVATNQFEQSGREVVFLENEEWRSNCLIAAWREFEFLTSKFPNSLVELAEAGNRGARRSLQEALAVLLVHDPDGVFHHVIRPLTKGIVAQRWVAANSLAAAARTESIEPFVISTIKSCARLNHGKGAASVAALCVANEFGRRRPKEAADIVLLLLEKWRKLDAALGFAIEGLVRYAVANAADAEIILTRFSTWPHWKELLNTAELLESSNEPQLVLRAKALNIRAPDALRFFAKQSAKPPSPTKLNPEIVDAAKLIAIVTAAILNPQDDSDGNDDAVSRSPVVAFAASNPAIADASAQLLVWLLHFTPTRETAWSLFRQMLRWFDENKAAGAVAILQAFTERAPKIDVQTLRENVRQWQTDPTVRMTIEKAFDQSVT